MDQTSITATGAIDTFLVLLIGIGPKIALVPFLEMTASLDPAAKRRVQHKMLATAATVAVLLMVLGELLRVLLHFTIGSLSIAGGVILLVVAVWMVLGPAASSSHRIEGKDPMQLAQFPLAVPYLLNPWASRRSSTEHMDQPGCARCRHALTYAVCTRKYPGIPGRAGPTSSRRACS